jgi:hypothetical protein
VIDWRKRDGDGKRGLGSCERPPGRKAIEKGEDEQLAEKFPVALRKTIPLIKGLPETPTIPLYC